LEEPDVLFKKVNIEVKSHEPEVLRSYEIFVRQVCDHLDLTCSVETRNSPIFDRLSLNKSPFIHKKHQRQYEFRTYIPHVTGCTASVFLEYIQRNLPAGVHMAVTHVSFELPCFLPPGMI
uniref:Small ribosomal subunit protein uS10m n=1 Tax=Schistocephalus solidus TaxID=70667 RepID=A0A183S8U2_SCHSO